MTVLNEQNSNYICGKPVYFRKSINADNNYTEHFYHRNKQLL